MAAHSHQSFTLAPGAPPPASPWASRGARSWLRAARRALRGGALRGAGRAQGRRAHARPLVQPEPCFRAARPGERVARGTGRRGCGCPAAAKLERRWRRRREAGAGAEAGAGTARPAGRQAAAARASSPEAGAAAMAESIVSGAPGGSGRRDEAADLPARPVAAPAARLPSAPGWLRGGPRPPPRTLPVPDPRPPPRASPRRGCRACLAGRCPLLTSRRSVLSHTRPSRCRVTTHGGRRCLHAGTWQTPPRGGAGRRREPDRLAPGGRSG